MIKTLYVIGNGFDLHHWIESGYTDYLKWLKKNHNDVYQDFLKFYRDATEYDWWKDLETNLGYPADLKEYADDVALANQLDEDDFARDHYIDEKRGKYDVEDELGGLVAKIKGTFHEWIKGLNKPCCCTRIHLDSKDSLFLNFNYSRTLEDFYHVNEDQILHIHGRVELDSKSEEFILGHGRSWNDIQDSLAEYTMADYHGQDPKDFLTGLQVDNITEYTRAAVVDNLYELHKDVDGIITQNSEFFLSLKDVEHVYIYGLSFGEVDLKYLETIIKSVSSTASYTINFFSEKDEANIQSFAHDNHITPKLIRLNEKVIHKWLYRLCSFVRDIRRSLCVRIKNGKENL